MSKEKAGEYRDVFLRHDNSKFKRWLIAGETARRAPSACGHGD